MASEYQKIWLAEFFHGFPHLDFSLSTTSATFDPDSENYKQAIALWCLVPISFAGLLLVLFPLCFRCCQNADNQICMRLAVGLAVSCIFSALLIYGNAELHRGLVDSAQAMMSTNETVDSSLQIMNSVSRTSDDVERKLVPELMEAVNGIGNSTEYGPIVAMIQKIGQNIDSTRENLVFIRNSTSGLHTDVVASWINTVEYVRNAVVIAICCLFLFLLLLIFVGIWKKSRKMLIITVVLIIVFTPALWGIPGFHLAFAVGSGDLCVDPNSFVLSQLNNTVDEGLLSVYMECQDKSQPFGEQMLNAQTSVSQALTALSMTVNMSAPYNITDKLAGPVQAIGRDLQSVFGNLSLVDTLVGSCLSLHNKYISVVRGVCNTALYGVGYMVLTGLLMALCSAVIVFTSPLVWRSFSQQVRGQGQGYEPVDDTDPFVPTTRSQQPKYGTFPTAYNEANGSHFLDAVSINDGDRPDSPPRPFFTRHLQEYANLAPTPNSIVRSS
ncbi:protein tweety homolog 1-B-like [Babylonia areolata]|uniref:protein tweety homolog 1-B-like n=1 Tax=Babylonia areolata TaxID=304850 RepID=UPI003FD14391